MRPFISFTLQQRVLFNLIFVLLIVVGTFTLLKMPIERYPNISFGKMYVNTYLPGASPEEVEIEITRKIEEGLEDLEDVEYIRSSSHRERSSVVIKFVDDSDYQRRFNDVRLEVLTMMEDLPELAEPPVFNFLDVNDWFPTISVNVGGDHTNTTLSRVAEELKILLSQLKGVKEVKLTGDYTREFHLLLSAEKLGRYGLTFSDIAAAIGLANISIPAGNAETETGELIVKVDQQMRGRGDLYAVVVRKDGDGSLLRVGDIAEAGYFAYRDPFIKASVNGEDCVTLQVIKDAGGNALEIAKEVREIVGKVQPVYSKSDINLTVTQDSSVRIHDSVRVLGVNLLLGIILVCLIIWLFMGFRNAALTTVGIPFAFLVTILLMFLTGNSINEVSLFAFVLVSGIIVDDAIVVVENIFRHQQTGVALRKAVVDGTAEVFLPVVSATLTTVVAFMPMLIMSGMVGDFFAIIPKTIVFALCASLLECLFILPCHYMEFGPRVLKGKGVGRSGKSVESETSSADSFSGKDGDPPVFSLSEVPEASSDGPGMRIVRVVFHHLIISALKYRFLSLFLLALFFSVAVVVFGASVAGKTNLVRIQFFPDDYSLFYAELSGPSGTSIEKTHGLVKEIAARLMEDGERQAESALGFAGYYINEDFSPQYGNHLGYVAVTLPSTAKRKFADYPENDVVSHLDEVRKKLVPFVPSGFELSVRPEKDGPPSGKDANIRVLGGNFENVEVLAKMTLSFLQNDPNLAPWLEDLTTDQGHQERVFRIRVDSERAALWDLTVKDVALLAASVMDGRIVGEMKLPEEIIDIRLKFAAEKDSLVARAMDTVIKEFAAGDLRLGDVCTPEFSLEPGALNRFQGQRAITITANIKTGAPVTSQMIVSLVEQFYGSVRSQFSGATLNYAGEYASTQKSFTSLAYAFTIAIVVIYLILAAQFQSYLQPMVIIAAVVFAITGVIWGTLLSRTLFTINSLVAVVGVTGVVVNDSLVLVDFINRCYRSGKSKREALLCATHIRLRPILLTTITTTLGLLPMALGIPEYSIIWGSMAMTFVTGLCTATFLTLIIIPLLWDIVAKTIISDPGD